jgi:lipopolysaccharide/colanic/teichoic acid biosynthesis glycosyltransferase
VKAGVFSCPLPLSKAKVLAMVPQIDSGEKGLQLRWARAHQAVDAFPGLPVSNRYLVVKTCAEFVSAIILLILLAPVMLLAILIVKLTSRGPGIYSQTRLGRNGRPFTIYKIRTMYHNCEEHSGLRWSTEGDTRVFPFGRFLRFTHIDEFPQLVNVLKGDMSLVGPRPERPEFVCVLEKTMSHYRERLLVRPGITGLAQIQLPPDTDLSSVRRKLAYDLYYIRQMTFWLDVRIVAITAFNLMGLPFAVMGGLLRVPSGSMVEGTYEGLNGQASVAATSPA